MRGRAFSAALTAHLVCLFGFLQASTASAELHGRIHAPSGTGIADATITAKDVATGSARIAKSDAAGIFDLPDLQPSVYDITVSATGFATERFANVSLNVGSEHTLAITLTLTAVNTTVEVRAYTSGVDLGGAALGGVQDASAIRELPLNGRDWTQLAALEPGVSTVRTQNSINGSSSNRGSRGFGSAVAISGARPTQNNYLVDGISLNDYTNQSPGGPLGVAFGSDAIQEFSVVTNGFGATFGGASGAVINAVSRSGSNVIDGDLYEYLRNQKLDARNFFDRDKPTFQRNQFGTALGGPLKQNKAFYFVNFEGLRQSLRSTSIATVPSPAARLGELSTGKIPVSPAVLPYLALWPLPNDGLLGPGDTGQYIFSAKSSASENFGLVKVDYLVSEKDTLVASWSADNGYTQSPDALNSIFVDNRLSRNTGYVSQTHVFNPQVVFLFRAGANRVTAQGLSTSPGDNAAASDPQLGVLPGRDAPALTVPGITTFAGGNNGLAATRFWFTNFQFYGDLSVQRGRHTLKIGAQLIRFRYNTQVSATPNGGYEFPSLADFLRSGNVSSFTADVAYLGGRATPSATGFPERGFRQTVGGVYAQDDLHLSTHLALNLGVRYEPTSVPTEVNGLLSNLRDIYGRDLNVGKQLFENPTHWNFDPRIALSWDPFSDGQTSFRAGFGIYDVLPLIYEVGMLEAYAGPASSLVTLLNLPPGSLSNRVYQTILALNSSNAPVREPSIEYVPPRNYVMQWNASVQRLLGQNPKLSIVIAYAGSRGVHMLSMFNDVNMVLPTRTENGYLFPLPIGSGERLNPALGAIRQLTWGDSSNYNSLQTRVQRKVMGGGQVTGGFTWQKSIDGYSSSVFPAQFQNSTSTLFIDRHLNRGPSDFNVGLVGLLTGVWNVPKPATLPRIIKAFSNGWVVTNILTVSDGMPFTPLLSGDAAGENSSAPYDVPDRVVGPRCTHLTNPRTPSQYINLSCYSFPDPANRLGNTGRNSVVGPGLAELDFGLHRNFPIKLISESAALQLRAEAFNLGNRANFEPPLPNNAPYNSRGAPLANAGVITSTATSSRQVQLALRLSW